MTAALNPREIDSLQRKDLTVRLNFDRLKDTISVKKDRRGDYQLDYKMPDTAQFLTIHIETENGFRQSKTVAMNQDHIDLQFFPESGELVHGLINTVGFKAVDYKGKGVAVEGMLYDQNHKAVTAFKSNHLGMGKLSVIADRSTSYYAMLTTDSKQESSQRYTLPKVKAKGNLLSVAKTEAGVKFMARSNEETLDTISFEVKCRGIIHYLIKGPLKQRQLVAYLPAEELPEGILEVTLRNADSQPIAERLYFNERERERLQLNLSASRTSFQREKTELSIEVINEEGETVNANLSVLVVPKEQVAPIQDARQNILSYFLVSSELKGEVEDPGYYFRSENKNRLMDLDALLLTQGWRNYQYQLSPKDTFHHLPEPNLTVSGAVTGNIFRKRKQQGVGLTMMTFGEHPSVYAQDTDSLGRFRFDIGDEQGEKVNVLIQSAKKSGKKRNYSIAIDEERSPDIVFNHQRSIVLLDSVVYAQVEKKRERKSEEDAYELRYGTRMLEEVVIEDYRVTPERQSVMDRYGKPRVVISGEAIQEKEQKWSYGLYSVLLFNFPEDIRIQRVGGDGGYLRAQIIGGDATLVVVDGIPVLGQNYNLIPNIPPSEVNSVELIRFAKNFSRLYLEAYPQASPMEAPPVGSVIAIYTHSRSGIFGAHVPVGIKKAAIPVFAPQREFYKPKYENLSAEDWIKPDLRSVIHWEPQVRANQEGYASTSFYNADVTGEVLVVVEAISADGEIGYQELTYDVVENPLSK